MLQALVKQESQKNSLYDVLLTEIDQLNEQWWQIAPDAGGLLLLSPFPETQTRITTDLARRRNECVAALADEAWFAHITPRGQAERLTHRLSAWRVPFIIEGSRDAESDSGTVI